MTFVLRRYPRGGGGVEWGVVDRPAYPSDVTDAPWAAIGPFLAAWKARHPSASGHQGRYELREIVNAMFYQNRTGCQWSHLPHDLPPKSAVYYYFAVWRDDGTDAAIHDLLRCQAREKAGRAEAVAVFGTGYMTLATTSATRAFATVTAVFAAVALPATALAYLAGRPTRRNHRDPTGRADAPLRSAPGMVNTDGSLTTSRRLNFDSPTIS